jgi:hypothetical protein
MELHGPVQVAQVLAEAAAVRPAVAEAAPAAVEHPALAAGAAVRPPALDTQNPYGP